MTGINMNGRRSLVHIHHLQAQVLKLPHQYHLKDVRYQMKQIFLLARYCFSSYFKLMNTQSTIIYKKNDWTQNMTKTYPRTCCFSGEIIKQFLTGANEIKQNDSHESILQPPNLWREHERLDI
jgi:hypothetical protein